MTIVIKPGASYALQWRPSVGEDRPLLKFEEPMQMRTVVGHGKNARTYWGKVPVEHRPVSSGVLYHPMLPNGGRL